MSEHVHQPSRHHQELFEPALARPTPSLESHSPVMQRVIAHARKVARADISVLISGASGTGKEVMARFIHNESNRHAAPFIAINCAAIPETMLEATLFGYEKGAFTGAQDRRVGKFEQADGGTLLLDEITEMPLGLQAKILRVLQEKELERLGGQSLKKVNVRVIATSNRNLADAVRDGYMREDLFYRLSVFPLELPSLVERAEDIIPLANMFLAKYGRGSQMSLADCAQHLLCNHDWPGNIRELENVMQRALVLVEGDSIQAHDLNLNPSRPPQAAGLQAEMQTAEEDVLMRTLRQHAGARKPTAQALGISERTLRYKLKALRDRGIAI